MYTGMWSSFFRICVVSLAMLFVVQVSAVLAATGVSDFEIPISELNNVKKKAPVKRVKSESKKKKKSEHKADSQANEKPLELDSAVKDNEALQKTPDAEKALSTTDGTQIHHTTYSFVVAGKRTVIHAVINSKSDVQEVTCNLIAPEGGVQTLVKMAKVPGTRFTYMATLPALPAGNAALRYTISVVDSLGKETRSQEYVTPVTSSPVVPSWQDERTGEPVPAEQKNNEVPRKDSADQPIAK